MIYVYDILLNFSTSLYEFYEWKFEEITRFKKIGLFKVSSKFIYDVFNKKVCVDKSFLDLLHNRSEIIINDNVHKNSGVCIFTDGEEFIGVKFNNDGLIIQKSNLFISDEIELLEICSNLNQIILDYNCFKEDFHRKKLRLEEDLDNRIKSILCNNLSDDFVNYLNLELFYEEETDKEMLLNKVLELDYFEKKNILKMLETVL